MFSFVELRDLSPDSTSGQKSSMKSTWLIKAHFSYVQLFSPVPVCSVGSRRQQHRDRKKQRSSVYLTLSLPE
jgi:hypothetical protein